MTFIASVWGKQVESDLEEHPRPTGIDYGAFLLQILHRRVNFRASPRPNSQAPVEGEEWESEPDKGDNTGEGR